MVDVLKSHVQDAISVIRLPGLPYNTGTNHESERPTAIGLKRQATEKIRRRNEERDQEKQLIDKSLYNIKELQSQDLTVQLDRNQFIRSSVPKVSALTFCCFAVFFTIIIITCFLMKRNNNYKERMCNVLIYENNNNKNWMKN